MGTHVMAGLLRGQRQLEDGESGGIGDGSMISCSIRRSRLELKDVVAQIWWQATCRRMRSNKGSTGEELRLMRGGEEDLSADL
jgi:hypothetical protein